MGSENKKTHGTTGRSRPKWRKLNVKFLAVVLVITALLGGGVHLLHGAQVKRNVGALKYRADAALSAGKLDEAVMYLGRYLGFKPNDLEALTDLGLTLDELAKVSKSRRQIERVFFTLDRVVRMDPERSDIRRRVIKNAMDIGRHIDAKEHIEFLRATTPDDAELEQQLALCYEALGQYRLAADWYEAAIKHAPDQILSFSSLAVLQRLRLNETPGTADGTIDRMVLANSESFKAYLARARYLVQFGSLEDEKTLEKVSQDVARARKLEPKEADVLWMAAEVVLARAASAQTRRERAETEATVDEARELFREGVTLHGQDVRFYRSLADLERRTGRPEEAVTWLRHGLETLRPEGSSEADVADLKWRLADLLIDLGQLAEAGEFIDELQKQRAVFAQSLEYLDARTLFSERKWHSATVKLELARPGLSRLPELAKQTDMLLAQCYGQLMDHDRQLVAYRRVLAADPLSVHARLGVAEALLKLGRADESLAEYQRMPGLPRAAVIIARLQVARTIRMKDSQRDWQAVNVALDRAERLTPDSAEVPILRAQTVAAQGQLDRAREILLATRDAYADSPGPWVVLADLADQEGSSAEALQLLEEAARRLGVSAELRLGTIRHWVRQGGEEARKVLKDMAGHLDGLPANEEAQLVVALAEAYARVGDSKESLRLWRQAAERQPDNLPVRLLWSDHATLAGDESEMKAALDDIRTIEGAAGPIGNLVEASRLVLAAKKTGEKKQLGEARVLLASAADRRPTWPAVPGLLGEIAELEQNRPKAIEHYQRAIELGDKNPRILRRLVELLYRQRRYADADQIARKLEEQSSIPSDVQRLASDLSFRVNDLERALELARQAVSSQPDNYRNHLWLGKLLMIVGMGEQQRGQLQESSKRLREAEQALSEAVKLAANAPDAWIALVGFLAGTGQMEKADSIIKQVPEKLSPDQVPLALAQCNQSMGRLDRAEAQYRVAMDARPDDIGILRNAVNFYVSTSQIQKAEPYLRQIIDRKIDAQESEVAWARRTLAGTLAAAGGQTQLANALELIEQNLNQGNRTSEDLRVKALTLVWHNSHRLRQEAIGIFEELFRRNPPTEREQFLLAQLYENEGNWPKARTLLRGLGSTNAKNAVYLATYARSLLRRGESDEAQLWVSKLEELEPQTFRTTSAKARLLGGQGNGHEAAQLLKKYLENLSVDPATTIVSKLRELVPQNKAEEAVALLDAYVQESDDEPTGQILRKVRTLVAQDQATQATTLLKTYLQRKDVEVSFRTLPFRAAASILEELNQTAAAEEIYREYVSRSQQPEATFVLLNFLARHGRIDEALDLCEPAWQTVPPTVMAGVSVSVLRGGSPTQQQFQRVERWLENAIRDKPNETSLLLPLADLKDRQERFEQAEAIYRQIIGLDARNVVALNNLAWLLAQKGAKAAVEALIMINRAMEVAGQAPELLDTRASVYLALRRPSEAVQDLELAIDRTPVGTRAMASKNFHLAQAYRSADNQASTDAKRRASEAWASAKASGLDPNKVHPLEREVYQKLFSELETN